MNKEKVTILSFYENWVELMEMCTPEEWYELCTIMTKLRFKGEDTNTKEIENIKVKMAWNLIKPSILKSNRNSRYNQNKKNENKPILNHENNQDNNLYHQDVESENKGLKMGKNEEFELDIIPTNKKDNNMGNLSGYKIENNVIVKEQETSYTPIGGYDDIKNFPSEEDFCHVIIPEPQSSNIEPSIDSHINTVIQDWLEDETNLKQYTRWIESLAKYKLNPNSSTYNTKEMALVRLNNLCEELKLDKKEFMDYINDDVTYSMYCLQTDECAA